MFKMAKNNTSDNSPTINFIGNGTTIKGDINSNGDFRIDGQLSGSIISKGKVVVGTSGKIEGDIVCQNADVSGTVNARLVVHELLTLKASAQVNGDIFINKLAIEPGAKFTGSCNMEDKPKEAPSIPPNNGKAKKSEEAVR
jgi:cytoskeletal protein CcmA (bactofilin family)